MPVDYAALKPGREISYRSYDLDPDTVARYVNAVGDESRLMTGADGGALAPPMAVAALGLRGVIEELDIPGGTLHTSQELEFNGPVRVGEALECHATLLQNSVRGDRRFIVVELAVEDGNHQRVLKGKSTLVLAL